jgi:hypothetical protein
MCVPRLWRRSVHGIPIEKELKRTEQLARGNLRDQFTKRPKTVIENLCRALADPISKPVSIRSERVWEDLAG